jgi:uncharacterized UPF0160 family protein
MDKKVTVVTHDLTFHADDIFAVATLLLVLGEENVKVVRSRDKEIVDKGDYVVDVGMVNDPEKNRFDHHQEGGAGVRPNGVPYASFGLVWKKFGKKISGNDEVAEKIDKIIVQWIDATDNAVQIIETKVPGVYPYDIGLFFNTFTPDWKEENINIDDVFTHVVKIAKMIFEIRVKNPIIGVAFV